MALRLSILTVIPSPYQRQLFAAMQTSGAFDLRVAYYSPAAIDRSWTDRALQSFEVILPGRTLTALGASAHWNPSVRSELRERDTDVYVISDYSAPTAQLAMWSLSQWRRPWIFWGERPGFQQRGSLGQTARRALQAPLRRASAIAAIGSWAVEPYREMVPGMTVANIPYFCDLEPYRAARSQVAHGAKETIDILCSGQLIPRKGIDVLLEAFLILADEHPKLRLLILGDGPERGALRAKVPPGLVDRVIFLGFLQPPEIPAVFANADIFVLPSRHDGWGVVINEALGAGLSIVATDTVGAAHDLVTPGVNGYRVAPGQVSDLVDVLGRLAASASLRTEMGAASARMSEQFDLAEGVKRWQSLCQNVVEHARVA